MTNLLETGYQSDMTVRHSWTITGIRKHCRGAGAARHEGGYASDNQFLARLSSLLLVAWAASMWVLGGFGPLIRGIGGSFETLLENVARWKVSIVNRGKDVVIMLQDVFSTSFFSDLLVNLATLAVTAIGALFIGNRISYNWQIRQKKKERDLADLQRFYELYGKFFAL